MNESPKSHDPMPLGAVLLIAAMAVVALQLLARLTGQAARMTLQDHLVSSLAVACATALVVRYFPRRAW